MTCLNDTGILFVYYDNASARRLQCFPLRLIWSDVRRPTVTLGHDPPFRFGDNAVVRRPNYPSRGIGTRPTHPNVGPATIKSSSAGPRWAVTVGLGPPWTAGFRTTLSCTKAVTEFRFMHTCMYIKAMNGDKLSFLAGQQWHAMLQHCSTTLCFQWSKWSWRWRHDRKLIQLQEIRVIVPRFSSLLICIQPQDSVEQPHLALEM